MAVKMMRIEELKTEWKRILAEDGTLLYVGYTYHGKPCGEGTAYFNNGNKYQEGQFGVKGLLSGKEYYPNGNLRFEGEYRLNTAYGPNAPIEGVFYDCSGKLVFQGCFQLRSGGVGYPTVAVPSEYGPIPQSSAPKELKFLLWNDVKDED